MKMALDSNKSVQMVRLSIASRSPVSIDLELHRQLEKGTMIYHLPQQFVISSLDL